MQGWRLGLTTALFGIGPCALAQESAHVEQGQASWYGEAFHGRPTASGEPFDQNRLTAAHPELPLGSDVEVTHLGNGRSVEVEITDRGPHGGGRVIDLSKAAAQRLDMIEDGIAEVRIEASKSALEE